MELGVAAVSKRRTEVLQAKAALLAERDGKKAQCTAQFQEDQRARALRHDTDILQVELCDCHPSLCS